MKLIISAISFIVFFMINEFLLNQIHQAGFIGKKGLLIDAEYYYLIDQEQAPVRKTSRFSIRISLI